MFESVTVDSEITSILHNCHHTPLAPPLLTLFYCQLWILHMHVCSAYNFLLSSTQSEVASRDANIRQLEERCELLEAQVSLAILPVCSVTQLCM